MPSAAVIPAALRDGDVIGVCSPAGRPPPGPLQRGLDVLAQRFTIKLGAVTAAALRGDPPATPGGSPGRPDDRPEAPASPSQGTPWFLAADDQARADEFNALVADRDVRAIIMARGGYGAMRILPALDPAPLVADPKPLVGFSDITAILAWAERAGVRGIHGPVVKQLGELSGEDVAWLHRVLTDPTPLGRLPWTLAGGRPGAPTVRGRLVIANLMMLARMLATPWQIDTAGAVVLIEEVGETPYAIDRELTQLGLAGALDRVVAAIVGDLVRCTDPPHAAGMIDDPAPAAAVIAERLARWQVPALTGAPVGHGARNVALPYGAAAIVDLSTGAVEVAESGVAR